MSDIILVALCFLAALILVSSVWRYPRLRWLLAALVFASFLTRFDWFKTFVSWRI